MSMDKSFRDLPYLSDADMGQGIGFEGALKKLNWLIYTFNRLSKGISLTKNFSGSTHELQFSAGETKVISHLLGVRPKFRIILRQEGNGVLSDIPSGWDEKVATIINNGAVTVNATIMFLKE